VESQKSFSSVATSNSFLKLMYKLSSHCSLHSPLLKQSVSLGFRSFLLVIVSIMKSRSSISYRKLSSREEEQNHTKKHQGLHRSHGLEACNMRSHGFAWTCEAHLGHGTHLLAKTDGLLRSHLRHQR
jgi:hypothetical protein